MNNVYEQIHKAITGMPAVDMSTKPHRFVTFNANGDMIVATAGAAAVGINQQANNVGQPVDVCVAGISFAICDGAVPAGAEIEVGADGKAKVRSTGQLVAIAVIGGATGKYCSVILK